jgi:hypothetical protein
MIDILMRRWNVRVKSVKVNPISGGSAVYVPLIEAQDSLYEEDSLDSLCGYDWADGFMLGILFQKKWESLFDDEGLSDCLTPIMLLNTGTIGAVVDGEIIHAQRKQMVEMIPRSVHMLWAHWQSAHWITPFIRDFLEISYWTLHTSRNGRID